MGPVSCMNLSFGRHWEWRLPEVTNYLRRSINEPIREGLRVPELWSGPDNGLIWCWERGRQKRVKEPDLAARAERGELVLLAWRGGVEKKIEADKKLGTLNYLATWQGLRGQDLYIDVEGEAVVVCSETNQAVEFSSKLLLEEE